MRGPEVEMYLYAHDLVGQARSKRAPPLSSSGKDRCNARTPSLTKTDSVNAHVMQWGLPMSKSFYDQSHPSRESSDGSQA